MTLPFIPFNKPCFEGKELVYIADAIKRGHVSGDGHYTKKCSEFFEREIGCAKALLTTSCTHALEIAALLLDLKPGDEVIVPSFTFVSTANAFALHGAKLVFADICPETLNIDHTRLEALIMDRTRAIVPVHYAGVGCKMDCIMDIATKHKIAVIEDNAHGLFAKYKDRNLGTFGCMSTLSFHETKNIICGEGGALLINDRKHIERAEIIREKGTNRSRMFRGEVDKYTWLDVGSSYLPSDMLAAFLYAQLEAKDNIQKHRKEIWHCYNDSLADWAGKRGIALPSIPSHCQQSYHMFYLIMPSFEQRQKFIAHLKSNGILSVFHYLPLHLSDMGIGFGAKEGDCPVTESISDRLVRLPFYNDLTEDDQQKVINTINSF